MKKQKVFCIEFHNQNGDVVPELSKCPAVPENVMAAMQFLDAGCDIVVSVVEGHFSDEGKFIVESNED